MSGLRAILTQQVPASLQTQVNQLATDVANILIDLAALNIEVDGLPLGEIGFAQTTTNTTGITSTVTDLTNLSVTVDVVSGREYKITGMARFVQNTSNSNPEFYVRTGTTVLNRTTDTVNAGQFRTQLVIARYTAPSNATLTFKLSASTGLGTMDTVFASDQQGFILVEDMGL